MKPQTTKGEIERQLLAEGLVPAGIDEVGRGCLAGPVTTACVVLDYEKLFALDPKQLAKIRDSKTLSAKQRGELLELLASICLDTGLGIASEREIEAAGILNATFLAMNRAVTALRKFQPNILLVDGNQKIKNQNIRQQPVVKGDSLCFAIAAASILAKEHRDAYMRERASDLPHWGFDRHVGYGTAEHLSAIKAHGICELHRKNFSPIREIVQS